MGQRLMATKTPVSMKEMGEALSSAWTKLWGDVPTSKSILILLAHYGIETGNGSSLIQFNVGNKRTGKGYTGDYCTFLTFEIVNGKRVNQDGDFRAYQTLELGCIDYLKGLKTGNFSRAWQAVIDGEPVAFCKLLKDAHYYTQTLPIYTSALVNRFYSLAGQGKLTTQDEIVAALISVGYNDVRSYQAARNLTVDGVFGNITRGHLALEVGA